MSQLDHSTEIKNILEALRRSYANLDYQDFCELLDFDPRYDVEYFKVFQTSVNTLFRLDTSRIIKLVEFGENLK